jgi:hypothetical protein
MVYGAADSASRLNAGTADAEPSAAAAAAAAAAGLQG